MPARAPNLQLIKRTVALVVAADVPAVAAMVMLSLAGGLLPIAVAYVGKLIVDGAVRALSTGAAADREHALMMVGLELGIMIATALIAALTALVRMNLATRLAYHIHGRILEKALTLDLEHFDDPAIYDKLQNARREASSRPLNVFTNVVGVATSAVTIASYAAILVAFSVWTLPILVAAAIPAFLAEAKFSGETFRVYSWRAPEQRRMRYLETLLTNDANAKEVKLYGIGALMLERYRALYQKLFHEERSLAMRRSLWTFLLGTVSTVALYGCYVWIVARTIDGALTLGDMTLYIAVFRGAQGALRGILRSLGSAYEDNLFMSNLFGFFELPVRGVLPARASTPRERSGFVLEDVCFRYPGARELAVSHVSLKIDPEEKLAIVGENGAGKTTLIKLLTGLYRPTSGTITLDGVPLEQIPNDELRARFGVVLQDYVRYQFTARDNVGLGKPEALGDLARIEEAAERGGAKPVVQSLPQGWDTQLGKWFEGGIDLSTGGWQKLAVSRAFMRDADILILDEPTASLDAEAEHALFERFKALTAGKMAILISHRFSTVRMADRIVVIAGGAIKEVGTHAELLAADGRYAHLFRLQAKGYLDV